MSSSASISRRSPLRWLNDQPYILLCLPSLFWAGNAIVGRLVAGHFPPVTLSVLRWTGAFLIILPFAWRDLQTDWPAIRSKLGVMVVMAICGISCFNTMLYTALEHTTALNALLLQSSTPLFLAGWSLVVLRVRLTLIQLAGILVSLLGVLTIIMHGDLTRLATIELNIGDVLVVLALAIFGLYSALVQKRPVIQQSSFLAFVFGCGALFLLPLLVWELSARPLPEATSLNLFALFYVILFPSTLAYLCYNRGVQLIGPNRSAPFFHLVPVFGSVMAIVFVGESLHLYHVIGYALVLAGIVVAARKPKVA
ncbi:DMT family transporter [Tardiphaga sp. P9-11]|jgi:drug/metabolite transporter (DMT)-like permease|uniref:DMT family transporter n=1 Tax=Tardiphaga sp. P9-11 TaxID=2024614 RepID=UPI0011F0E76A|nr:DMT family transporter [Tardiphaga sp. P9-11]KAA0074092.1 DMT family transporter [Tardiphaga sp. P9-11]